MTTVSTLLEAPKTKIFGKGNRHLDYVSCKQTSFVIDWFAKADPSKLYFKMAAINRWGCKELRISPQLIPFFNHVAQRVGVKDFNVRNDLDHLLREARDLNINVVLY